MKIECNSISEFLRTLEDFRGAVVDDTVRVRVDRTPEQQPAVSFMIGMWMTALVETGAGIMLLEYSDRCGSDTPRRDEENGEEIAQRWLKMINDACADSKLKVRGGRYDY